MLMKNVSWFVAATIAALTLVIAVPAVQACGGCAPCASTCCCCPPTVQYVQKTIMIPTWEIEYRKIQTTECRPKTCRRMVTVHKPVTTTEQVPYEYTVMMPKKCTKTVNYTVCVPVTKTVDKKCCVCVPVVRKVEQQVPVCVPEWTEVEKKYVVQVPVQETREGVRTVCRCVSEKQTCTVCKDKGHWEDRPVATCCAPTCCAPTCCAPTCCAPPEPVKTCKVWVPKIVKEEIEVTVTKPKLFEEPCEYTVTVCKPKVCTKKVKECNYKTEMKTVTRNVCKMVQKTCTKKVPVTTCVQKPQSKEVEYTVCVPVTKTGTRTVCKTQCVPQKVPQTYTVMVPVQVEKVVPVRVCKMVPRTITVPVCCPPKPCCAPACGCN